MPSLRFRSAAAVPFLALVLLGANFDHAQAQTRDVKLTGMGIRKCSQWQQWKDSRNAESRAMVLEWAQGFIAGHNVYARAGRETVSPVVASVSVLIPLLDSYCQKNPEDRILSGVIEITRNLGGAKVNLSPKAPSSPPLPPAPTPQPERKGRLDS